MHMFNRFAVRNAQLIATTAPVITINPQEKTVAIDVADLDSPKSGMRTYMTLAEAEALHSELGRKLIALRGKIMELE